MKKSVYLNQRVRKDVVVQLRKYEKSHKLPSSISATVQLLLLIANQHESSANQANW